LPRLPNNPELKQLYAEAMAEDGIDLEIFSQAANL